MKVDSELLVDSALDRRVERTFAPEAVVDFFQFLERRVRRDQASHVIMPISPKQLPLQQSESIPQSPPFAMHDGPADGLLPPARACRAVMVQMNGMAMAVPFATPPRKERRDARETTAGSSSDSGGGSALFRCVLEVWSTVFVHWKRDAGSGDARRCGNDQSVLAVMMPS